MFVSSYAFMIASSVSAGDGAERTGLFYCSQPADCTALPCTIFAVLNFIQWGAIRLCPVARFKPNEVRKSTKKVRIIKGKQGSVPSGFEAAQSFISGFKRHAAFPCPVSPKRQECCRHDGDYQEKCIGRGRRNIPSWEMKGCRAGHVHRVASGRNPSADPA